MEGKMKAAVLTEIGKIEIEERPIPKPLDNEVLVKIKHVGICGSDLHYYEHGRIGNAVVEKPIILGHESAGEVVEIGKNVTNLKVGDIVTLEPGYTCGKCEFCKTGRYNLCPDVVFMATPPIDGAFAEYVSYPSDMAFKLPSGMTTIEGALVEPLSVGFHAAKQADAHIGQTAAILGAGCIGISTMLALKSMGVTEVYMFDMIQKRLDMAKKLGATGVYRVDEVDPEKVIKDVTDGNGVDLVFETAGNKTSTLQTVSLVKRGGKITLVGMAPESILPFNIGGLMEKEASVNTVFRYRNLYPTAIKAVASGLIPVGDMVTDTFKFEDTAYAMKYSVENKRDIVKAVIEF